MSEELLPLTINEMHEEGNLLVTSRGNLITAELAERLYDIPGPTVREWARRKQIKFIRFPFGSRGILYISEDSLLERKKTHTRYTREKKVTV